MVATIFSTIADEALCSQGSSWSWQDPEQPPVPLKGVLRKVLFSEFGGDRVLLERVDVETPDDYLEDSLSLWQLVRRPAEYNVEPVLHSVQGTRKVLSFPQPPPFCPVPGLRVCG
jgi:hypothetical protein